MNGHLALADRQEAGTACAEAAVAYHEDGFALLPLAARSKEPNVQVLKQVYGSTSTGRLLEHRASKGEILEWLEADPTSNLGIVTGPSELVVVDFDREMKGLRLPETPTVQTKRGLQVYLRIDAETKSRKLAWGEIRSGRQYVVAPPSIHPSGIEYRWEIAPTGRGNGVIAEAELAPASEFIAQLCEHGLLGDSKSDPDPTPVHTQSGICRTVEGGLLEAAEASSLLVLVRDPAYVVAVSQLVGIPHAAVANIGKNFLCVLPGHADHRPSASLFRDPKYDVVVYRDWHRDGRYYALAEVYAAQISGRVRGLRGPSRAQWTRRLLIETGLLEPAPVSLPPLPDDAPRFARAVYAGYQTLFACRWTTEAGEPAPFTLEFARDWCGGISEWQVNAGKAWLVKHGYLRKVGEHKRATLWLPGNRGQP